MTYYQAFNKITEAYIKGEIKPMDSEFCFCGTLHGGAEWNNEKKIKKDSPYSHEEYKNMEMALFGTPLTIKVDETFSLSHYSGKPIYEHYLFKGMCYALEVLKQIHIERGEIIDEIPVFTKRKSLSNA